MAKSLASKVDVRYTRTKSEWLIGGFLPGIMAGVVVLVVGFVAGTVLRGVGKFGFGAIDLGMRPVYMVGAIVFAIVTGVALSIMRPRLVSGGSGAGGNGPARRARVWAGPAAVDELGDDGDAVGPKVSHVRAV